MRKIAANYIYWPGYPLVKNGYIVLGDNGSVEVVDTGGEVREIAGLEFYGGLIVPEFVCRISSDFRIDAPILPVLDSVFSLYSDCAVKAAIIEGADLRSFVWKAGAHIRLL